MAPLLEGQVMPHRPAQITQADVARIIRAAKAEGVAEVEIRLASGSVVVVRMETSQSTDEDVPLAPHRDFHL
jgi:hypothetical protein